MHKPLQKLRREATRCLSELKTVADEIEFRYFAVGRLLLQIRDNSYYLDFGYSTFSEWFENENLGFLLRKAEYLMRFAKVADDLNLTDHQLTACGTSKLRQIMGLNHKTNATTIRSLINQAPEMSLDDVRAKVAKLTGKPQTFMYIVRMPSNQAVKNVRKTLRGYGDQWSCSDGEALIKLVIPKSRAATAGR